MKHLVGKLVTKKVPFCGDEVEIKKLSVSEVLKVQSLVTKTSKSKDEKDQISLLRDILRIAVVGAEDMTDADFDTFPLGELSEITESILAFSGLKDSSTVGN